MKDKISKIKNLLNKYGVKDTIKKCIHYIFSNYIMKVSPKEKIYAFYHRKRLKLEIETILKKNEYDRIIIWRSGFGWDVPLYQRPQHIFLNLAKQKSLIFYEVTEFTDNVKRIKKQCDNLYLVNYTNRAFSNLLFKEIEKQDKPRYLQFYSTDWLISKKELMKYVRKGYNIVYEYIDDLSPSLAGTDQLPINIKEKYEYVMSHKEVIIVVTADALWQDTLAKRGAFKVVFSGNGVDYDHFHDNIDSAYEKEDEFEKIFESKKPVVGYYGALASWFDYELLTYINNSKEFEFVLFGIKYDDSYDKAKIDKLEHVHFMGSRNYNVLQNYASQLDILTIPFVINDITKATSPVKLFEYMALGKPIVTTDMDECRKYESVLIAQSKEEFLQQLRSAYKLKEDKNYLRLLEKEAQENTWSQKAKLIIEEIQKFE